MSDLLARLVAAGTPPELVGEVAMLIARAEVDREAIASRRAADRDRSARRRGHVTSRDVTGDSVTTRDVTDTPPVLDKETSPRPPKEINPTPRAACAGALARKAAGFGPPEGVDLHTWNAFCSQRKKPLSEIAYSRMLTTLAECAEAGWPPGEVVERSIEKTWETLYVPTERRNGQSSPNRNNSGLGRTAAAAISVFGPPGGETFGPAPTELRRIGVG